jgi:hypothetical protein
LLSIDIGVINIGDAIGTSPTVEPITDPSTKGRTGVDGSDQEHDS